MFRYLLYFLVMWLVGSLLLEIFRDDIFQNISTFFIDYRLFICAALGFFLFYILSEGLKNKEKRSGAKFKFFILSFALLLAFSTLNLWFIETYFDVKDKFYDNILISFVVGFLIAIIAQQLVIFFQQKVTSKTAIQSTLERSRRSDMRNFEKVMMKEKPKFDPKKYFKKDAFFLALDENDKPVYWNEKVLPHIEICGTTGSGKGVSIGPIMAQCAYKGEAVFVIDPKDDEWLPHVAYAAAQEADVSFNHLNIREPVYQFNLFKDTDEEEREELLLAGLELSDRGEASDFYKIADRKMASFVATTFKDGQTIESFYAEHASFLEKEAPGFAGKFRELASIKAINATDGISLKDIIARGGMVYITGSMRNTKIVRVQKMLLVRLIQLAEKRNRMIGQLKPIAVVLDELKYHLSRTALEALGAARDKGLHLIMAHQSIADLRDCPKDLDPDAVVGAVLENTKIKLVYRVEMPETAQVFAEKSGTILVDDETRNIERSLSLAESVSSERKLSQSEAPLIDKNEFLTLPTRCGVLFGVGLPKKIYTSPYVVEKNRAALEIQNYSSGNEVESEILDFGKL